jgi:hypothetical protein
MIPFSLRLSYSRFRLVSAAPYTCRPPKRAFIFLFISNFLCTKGEGGEGGGKALLPLPGQSEFSLSRWRARGWLAGQSEFTFSLWRRGGKGRGPLEGVGPEYHINIQYRIQNTEFGPKWNSLRSLPFQGPKKSGFSGHTPSNGTRNGFSPIKIITSRAI